MKQKLAPKRNKKKIYIVVIVAILLIGAGVAYVLHQSRKPKPAETTSTSKTAQSDYDQGKERPTDGQNIGTNQGGAVDNKGSNDNTSTPGEPKTVSSTGMITVLGLSTNSLLKNGDALRGTTDKTIGTVQFRVLDEATGVVAQGELSVVDGTFSGTLHFNAKSATGRIDVFNFDAGGREANNIEIPVRFK